MRITTSLQGLALLTFAHYSFADLTNLEGLFANSLEESAAKANQVTYERLREAGCDDQQRGPTESCDGATFRTWASVREVVHTANALTESGPATYSLGLDLENLGFVLRWTAGEEFSTQGDMSTNFVRAQTAGVAARIGALRAGGSGLALSFQGVPYYARSADGAYGGGGAGEDTGSGWSPWGFYLNADYRSGDRTATAREDAFDFDGVGVTGGLDYRLNPNWVVGAMLGYQTESLEFDPRQSIAEGDVDMTGLSLQPYVLYSTDTLFASAAVGFQTMDFETYRVITYPSFNPLVESVDTAATSDTSASAISVSGTLGYTLFSDRAFGVEPFVALDYRDVSVDGYTETDIENDGFAFSVAEQSFDSLESTLGVKLNYVLTPRQGVFIPYLDLAYRTQHRDDPRYINAFYVDAADSLDGAPQAVFSLPTDKPDSNYLVYTLGVSAVLRVARQTTLDGPASGGLQAFVQYRSYQALEHYTQSQIAAGLRYEF